MPRFSFDSLGPKDLRKLMKRTLVKSLVVSKLDVGERAAPTSPWNASALLTITRTVLGES